MLGASRRQLIAQFLGESLLVAGDRDGGRAGAGRAQPAAAQPLPRCRDEHHLFRATAACSARSSALVLLVGLAGGLYPAFFLSRFQPAKMLEGEPVVGRRAGHRTAAQPARRRPVRGLDRPDHLHRDRSTRKPSTRATADPGYEREGLLQIDNIGRATSDPARVPTLLREIGKVEGVRRSAARPSASPPCDGEYRRSPRPARPRRSSSSSTGSTRLLPRRWASRRSPAAPSSKAGAMDDSTIERFPPDPATRRRSPWRGDGNVVLNELAARRLGYRAARRRDRQDAAAPTTATSRRSAATPVTIVGVVEDSRFRSIREPIEPMIFRLRPPAAELAAGPLHRHRRRGPRPHRTGVAADRAGRPVRGRVQRGHRPRALRRRGGARGRSSPPSPCWR